MFLLLFIKGTEIHYFPAQPWFIFIKLGTLTVYIRASQSQQYCSVVQCEAPHRQFVALLKDTLVVDDEGEC